VEGINDLVAVAPLTCAGLTTFRAIKKARNVLDVDDYVIVVGLGGLGAYAVQWLRVIAPYVNIIGVDTRDEAIEFVSKIAKLDEVINASEEDPSVQTMIITKGKGAKVVLDFVGPKALPTYFLTLSKRGVYILVGLMSIEKQ
jgi:D-arabinose 1-dehydrogenase-like Zn-dependent alcohol dehydrogenase